MYDNYGSEQAGKAVNQLAGLVEYQSPTARLQLERKRAALNGELAKVDAALKALDAHPELEAFTETLKAALR